MTEKQSLGDRAADIVLGGMGTWAFVLSSLGAMVGWIVTLGVGIDNPQLTILNLGLSCIAAEQGALLLISSKRRDAKLLRLIQETHDATLQELAKLTEIAAALSKSPTTH